MVKVLVAIGKFLLNIFYFFIKFLPVKNRITFISRQADSCGVDFKMLIEGLEEAYPQYEVLALTRTLSSKPAELIKYGFHMLRQMVCCATSRVVVLDSYCIVVSVLKHKRNLKVLQLWHALGAFKKFGYSVLDKGEGSSRAIARAMKMHYHYDYAVVSGPKCVCSFAEAFHMERKNMIPIGLPRMDYLLDEEAGRRVLRQVLAVYPQLDNGKKNILYAPTFRKEDGEDAIGSAMRRIVDATDFSRFNLIIKTHSGHERIYVDGRDGQNKCKGKQFVGMDFLKMADYVISDYSSIIFEASLVRKPLYLYCFDCDTYLNDRGFYLDYFKDIPAVISRDAAEIMEKIGRDERVDMELVDEFARKYVQNSVPDVTGTLTEIIVEMAQGIYDERYNYRGKAAPKEGF